MAMKKRDVLEGSLLLGKHKIEVGPVSASLATQYVAGRREGTIAADVDFMAWLDTDLETEAEIEDLASTNEAASSSDPT
jgi:hypothetical protein